MNSTREKVIVGIATLIFFGAFGAVYLLDEPHGDVIGNIDQSNVKSKLILNQGHITDPGIPEGLIIFGAGKEASLKFEVFNEDTEGDVDTILISIPGSEVTNGSYEWYESGVEHQWNITNPDTDSMMFQAQDDFMGSVSGGSSHYDVAGNIDDALDSVDGTNEGITLTIEFEVPDDPGLKMGSDSIDLLAGNLKTEDPGSDLASIEPYPFPYIISQNGDSYRVLVLKTGSCDLDVIWGSEQLFSSVSRAGEFQISDHGYKYRTEDDHTVVVLDDPGDIPVKPIVSARESGLTGFFNLDIFSLEIIDIDSGDLTQNTYISDYQGEIPSDTTIPIDTDIDGDGLLNGIDDDIDGDGIKNIDDQFPYTYNRAPVVITSPQDIIVREGEVFTLVVEAEDPEDETLTYIWKHDNDDTWVSSGNSVTISDLEPGTYNFSIEISDELGNVETRYAIVTVQPNESPFINDISADKTKINAGEDVELTVDAEDPENDTLSYQWTHDQDQDWSMTGNRIVVLDLEIGTYTFLVKVSDGRSEVSDEIIITVEDDDDELGILPFIVIAVVVVILIVVVVLVLVFKKKDSEMDNGFQSTEKQIQINTEISNEDVSLEVNQDIPQINEPVMEDYPTGRYEEPNTEPMNMETAEIANQETSSEQYVSNDAQAISDNEDCPECGSSIGPDENKCSNCGAEFDIKLECPVCGHLADNTEQNCPMCGSAFSIDS